MGIEAAMPLPTLVDAPAGCIPSGISKTARSTSSFEAKPMASDYSLSEPSLKALNIT